MRKVVFNIDVVSACNLMCPSCPIGNSKNVKNSTGLMSQELLDKILHKASSECEIEFIGLFNWTEPLIHPRLVDLVELAESYGPCHLSSNLNLSKVDFESLLATNLELFRISLSGFNQSIYSRTHQGGDIEIVKRNMAKLSEAVTKVGSKTSVQVLYHRYLGNIDDEPLMKEYSEDLGFSFEPVWAYMMPIEKVLQFIDDPRGLSAQDGEIIKILALPPDEEIIRASQSVRNDRCSLLEDQITLNSNGVVQLCCSVYDQGRFSIASFLDTSFEEIQSEKRKMEFCRNCMAHGVNNLMLYNSPQYDRIAGNRVIEHYKDQMDLYPQSTLKRIKRLAARVIRR